MNNDLISREGLKKAIDDYAEKRQDILLWQSDIEDLIDNAPTVEPEGLKPLVDKVLEVLPELTDAIIKELPKIVSCKIKCSECSYYTNALKGEWIYTQYDGNPNIGNWHCSECRHIVHGGYSQKPYYNFCSNCGADMRQEAEE